MSSSSDEEAAVRSSSTEGQSGPLDLDPGLSGATALVTGASGDIGRAVAIALSSLGFHVCLVGRSASSLHATAAQLSGPSMVVPTDLGQTAAVASLARRVDDHFDGELDILVHGADLYLRGPVEMAPVDDLDRMYESNLRGPYLLTQQLLPLLRNQRGQVVFVNSTQARSPSENVGPYAATRSALDSLAESLRKEVNRHGVRVLTLHLGRTAGARQEKIFREEGRLYQPELLLQPADIARTIVWCLTFAPTVEVTDVTVRPAIKSY